MSDLGDFCNKVVIWDKWMGRLLVVILISLCLWWLL